MQNFIKTPLFQLFGVAVTPMVLLAVFAVWFFLLRKS